MRLDALPRSAPALWSSAVSLAALACFSLALIPAATTSAMAQEASGRFRVLVVPLQSGPLKDRFGEKVADLIRDRLEQFPTHAPVEEREFDRALRRYEVKKNELNPIKARQLANLMGAQVVFFGSIKSGGQSGGHPVQAVFIDVQTGDEVDVPPVTIANDKDEEAQKIAQAAIGAFEEQVRFVRARQFCADYVGSQQPENALRNCNDALEINPRSGPALFNKGLAFRLFFERATGEELMPPGDPAAQDTSLEAIATRSEELLENDGDGQDGAASLDAEARQWGDSAVTYFEKVLEAQPGNREAMQNAAYVYTRLGEAERASELYQQYLELDPGNVPVRLKVAYDLAQGGLMEEAIEVIGQGLERDSTNVDLLQFYGDYNLRYSTEDTTRVDVALNAYEKVLEIKGEETDLQLMENVLAAYTRAGRTDAAIDFAERALAARPDAPRLWSLYADALARAQRHMDAASAMDSVIKLQEDYPNAYLKRGMFRLESGDDQAAQADFKTAIEVGGSNRDDVFRIFWAKAHSLREAGELNEALDYFRLSSEYTEGQQQQEVQFWWGYTFVQLAEGLAEPENAGVERLRQAERYFRQGLQHLESAGNVRKEVAQMKDYAQKWLQNVDARIRRAQRAGP